MERINEAVAQIPVTIGDIIMKDDILGCNIVSTQNKQK